MKAVPGQRHSRWYKVKLSIKLVRGASELFIMSLKRTLKYHSLLTHPLLFIKRGTLSEQSATSQSK